MLLRTGVRGKSAVELARELLDAVRRHHANCWRRAPSCELIKGLGPAKRAQFAAAIELARRCARRRAEVASGAHLARRGARLPAADTRRPAGRGFRLHLAGCPAPGRSTSRRPFRGTLTQTSVYPREIVKTALARNAAAVIFAHNHPSGVAQPSQADELLTRNLKEALALVEVKVLDHFIVAGNQAISFAERGLL